MKRYKKITFMKNEKFIYDRSLRELFQDVPKTLIKLLVGKEIKEIVDSSFPKLNQEYEKRVKEVKMPFVIELESDPVYTKGREKGRLEGRLEGQMEEKIAIARSLLEIHDDKTIAKIVRLPIEDIKKIREGEEI